MVVTASGASESHTPGFSEADELALVVVIGAALTCALGGAVAGVIAVRSRASRSPTVVALALAVALLACWAWLFGNPTMFGA